MILFLFILTSNSGFMHFWGIVIDTAAAVLLSVALGLAVDYSAHIAHAFMTTAGNSRNERVKKTIVEIYRVEVLLIGLTFSFDTNLRNHALTVLSLFFDTREN